MTPDPKPASRPSGRQKGDHLQYLLTAYLFGDLSVAGRAEVEGHLKDCASCRQELDGLRVALAVTEEAIQSERKAYFFDDRRRARVLAGARQARHGFLAKMGLPVLPRFNARWARIAALLMVLLTGGFLLLISAVRFGNSAPMMERLGRGDYDTAQASPSAQVAPSAPAGGESNFSYSYVAKAKEAAAEDTIVTTSLEKRKPKEYGERGPADKFKNPTNAPEDLPPVEHPVVKHEEVEVSDHNETADDMDRATAKGDSEKSISDVPLENLGRFSAIGIGGGRRPSTSYDKKKPENRPSPTKEDQAALPIQVPKPVFIGTPKAPSSGVRLEPEKPERELKSKSESRLSETKKDALKEPQPQPSTPAEPPSESRSLGLDVIREDVAGRWGGQVGGEGAPPPPPISSTTPAPEGVVKKSQSVGSGTKRVTDYVDTPEDEKGLKERASYGRREAKAPVERSRETEEKPSINAEAGDKLADALDKVVEKNAAEKKNEDAFLGSFNGNLDTKITRDDGRERTVTVAGVLGSTDEKDSLNALVHAQKKTEVYDVSDLTLREKDMAGPDLDVERMRENVRTRGGQQVQDLATHEQQQGQQQRQQQVLAQSGEQAEALNKMLKRNENAIRKVDPASTSHGWSEQDNTDKYQLRSESAGVEQVAPGKQLVYANNWEEIREQAAKEKVAAETNKGREAIQQLYDNYVKDDVVNTVTPDSTEREPEKSEALLRAFNYFQADNKRLDIAEFLRRPASIPAPLPCDEGLDEDAFIEKYGIRPFVDASRDHLSTFGLDVDTASYTRTRALLQQGQLPPADTVRTEEFVNYFKQDYTVPGDETFGVFVEGMPAPFAGPNMDMVKIGIKSRDPRPDERKPAALTFVVDVSGSMARADNSGRERVDLIRASLKGLVGALQPEDSVCLVTFSDQARLALPRTQARFASRILDALDRLEPGGATNVEAGLEMGYRMADEAYSLEAINRVILCSDGVANVGAEGPEQMLKLVKTFAGRGIDLNAVGFGMGKYNDRVMQELADRGNGSYHFVNTPQEAEKVFREQLPPNLDTLARDAKAQVDFDPAMVKRYRLLGYEKRKIADADFRNDKIDAGEVAHSTMVTALYEIERQPGAHGMLGKIFLRWKDAALPTRPVVERNYPLSEGLIASTRESADANLRFLACVAEFAELLRGSRWAQDGSFAAVLKELGKLPADFRVKPEWKEVRDLVWKAHVLSMREWLGIVKH